MYTVLIYLRYENSHMFLVLVYTCRWQWLVEQRPFISLD